MVSLLEELQDFLAVRDPLGALDNVERFAVFIILGSKVVVVGVEFRIVGVALISASQDGGEMISDVRIFAGFLTDTG